MENHKYSVFKNTKYSDKTSVTPLSTVDGNIASEKYIR